MNAGHEQSDADVISLFRIAIALFLSTALLFLAIWFLMRILVGEELTRVKPPATLTGAFPQPRLEVRPTGELEKLRATEQKQLDSYGWIDRPAGIARIPIDRAMELLVERGLPDVGGQQTPLQLMQARPQEVPSRTPQ